MSIYNFISLNRLAAAAMVCGLFGVTRAVPAADWGNLSGQFIDTAAVPAATKLTIDKDQGYCGPLNLVSEALVVGKKGELANVVVMLKPKLGEKVKVNPDLVKGLPASVTLDNKGCRFDPHIVGMTTQQKLILKNADPMAHNSKLEPFANAGSNPLIPSGQSTDEKFPVQENLPVKVTCSIHSWMSGWIVVRDTPYFAISDAQGKFEIKDLPVGEYNFVLWQEKIGYLKEVTIGGKTIKLEKGILKQKIASGANALGEIKVDIK
jgi:hypothetical protein